MVGNVPWYEVLQFVVDAGVICFVVIYVLYNQLQGRRSDR